MRPVRRPFGCISDQRVKYYKRILRNGFCPAVRLSARTVDYPEFVQICGRNYKARMFEWRIAEWICSRFSNCLIK